MHFWELQSRAPTGRQNHELQTINGPVDRAKQAVFYVFICLYVFSVIPTLRRSFHFFCCIQTPVVISSSCFGRWVFIFFQVRNHVMSTDWYCFSRWVTLFFRMLVMTWQITASKSAKVVIYSDEYTFFLYLGRAAALSYQHKQKMTHLFNITCVVFIQGISLWASAIVVVHLLQWSARLQFSCLPGEDLRSWDWQDDHIDGPQRLTSPWIDM